MIRPESGKDTIQKTIQRKEKRMALRRAKKSEAKLKIGFSGPSGSGKTYSALLVARGFMGTLDNVGVLDTEGGSADLYAGLGNFVCEKLDPPFHPQRYLDAIKYFIENGIELMILDSVSHEWEGPGGCLEMQQKLGGKFQDWKTITPLHQKFISGINRAPIHIFTTVRRKQDYVLEQNIKGKMAPKKVGLKEVQRDGFEYELTTSFDIDMNHNAIASKDRTSMFSTEIPFEIGEETGKQLRKWNLGEL